MSPSHHVPSHGQKRSMSLPEAVHVGVVVPGLVASVSAIEQSL